MIMGENMIVRHISPEELDALLMLYTHLHREDAPLPEKPELDAIWTDIISNPLLHYIVGEWKNEIVSSCTLTIIPNLTRGARPYGLIENVVTNVNNRERGFGTAVLSYALQVAWEANCYKVMLLTGSKEDSMFRFYEGAGFRRGTKTGFIAYPPEKDG
jgi:GNAT superfamily N-acetyltransferase